MAEYWKHPAKRLDREFRAMGARRVERNSRGVYYEFEDGAREFVPQRIAGWKARATLQDIQRRYANAPQDPLHYAEKVRGEKPTIDLEQVVASTHAKERFELMSRQAGLTYDEILLALRAPARVLWSHPHGSWLWVGDRICVAASVHDDGVTVIRTLLWTSQELWAANPRPA